MALWYTNYKRLWAQQRENWNHRVGRCVDGNQKAIGNSTDFYSLSHWEIYERGTAFSWFYCSLFFFLYILLAFFPKIEIIIYYYFFSNGKFYSIFFLNENCFENNCPNTLGTFFLFLKIIFKNSCQTVF
jgi:hypothetical protein